MRQQLEIVQTYLEEFVGYRGERGIVVPDYQFVVGDGTLVSADHIAFADPHRQDISSACIAVKWWSNGENKSQFLEQVSYLGTPLTLFVNQHEVEWWPVQVGTVAEQPLQVWEINRLDHYFRAYSNDLRPEILQEARHHGRQLSFFHIDSRLEPFARRATQEVLVRQFTTALQQATALVNEQATASLLRVAIWTLAARILQDKLHDDSTLQTRNISELFEILKRRFDRYFVGLDDDISRVGLPAVERLYSHLLDEFSFRSLTNDMLAYFYENALVDESLQKELGIYYTPRFLSEMMLQQLPLENFRPEERTVFDGTCGSGNLLLAAYSRLRELLPRYWSPGEKHQYLLQHIRGVDIDPFACEVARLSLLLYNLPAGDDWQIESDNVFNLNDKIDFSPVIIVGNPPFYEPRTTSGTRVQKAAEVLKIYLTVLSTDGLLAIILPLTFLFNRSTSEERQFLLETCDIYEVWHLGQGVISNWNIDTAVIIARKHTASHQEDLPTKVIEVLAADRTRFMEEHRPTTSYITSKTDWLIANYHSMASSPLDDIFYAVSDRFEPIQPNYCKIYNGVQPGKEARKTHLKGTFNGEEWRKVLASNIQGQTLEQYRISWQNQDKKYIKYPSPHLQWPRTAEHFDIAKKIILNATRNASSPWRLMAAVDEAKLVPTENFHYGLVQVDVTVEEVVAVLNSTFANAWYSRNFQGRDINLTVLKQLPFPVFTREQQEQVVDLVTQVANEISNTRAAILQLDEIVFSAYGLSQEEQERVKKWMARSPRPRPGIEWADEAPAQALADYEVYRGERWRMVGEVLAVSVASGTVLIEPDYGEAQEILIPDSMPGWAMRPGAAFEALIPIEQAYETDLRRIDWLKFEPLDYGYLNEEELVEAILSV